ncbi:integrase catalytic domain-containing protein [Trichonephila clavipes]|nr:integrase catalytic domain-containing protein [Trichonephila clavipes]
MAPKELSELTVFNRRKAHLLGQITRIRNSLENVDSPLNQVEIRTKLASLSEVKAKIDKLRTESYRILSDEELMDFETSLDTMEVDADNLEVSINTLLESSNVDTSELSVKNDFANYNVKLPSINLPEFSGQYIDWLQFKSQFVSLIHDNACLSDSQKLYYLQSALKGHAKQLQTVNDSYSSLFEALEGRYENKRLIVNSHIAELLNPNKIKFESAFHLRSLIDSIQSNLRALKQLELEPNALCESMLIFVITQRLDDESRKQYEMELHSNDLPKWNNFLDFLIKRSQALENVQRNSSLKNKNEYSPKFRSFVMKSNEKPVRYVLQRHTQFLSVKCFTRCLFKKEATKLKCLLQELWLRKLSWDDELPPDIHAVWSQWWLELPFLSELKIPRKILDSSGDSSEVQIHTFSDASQKAYGAAAFLRVKHKDRVSVDLVTSKSRVAPLKRLSLPRLELMGALLAARLAKEVKKILDQKCSTRAFFWTDSQVTLHWIKGPSHRWKPFVANRVREIQSLTDPNSWFHCSGKDNPADLLTRGISVDALTTNSSGGMDPRFYVKLTSRPKD